MMFFFKFLNLVDEAGVLNQVSYGTPMGRESTDFYKQIPIHPMPYGQAMAIDKSNFPYSNMQKSLEQLDKLHILPVLLHIHLENHHHRD